MHASTMDKIVRGRSNHQRRMRLTSGTRCHPTTGGTSVGAFGDGGDGNRSTDRCRCCKVEACTVGVRRGGGGGKADMCMHVS